MLLDRWGQTGSIGQDPQLQELHGLVLGTVLLRMLGAGAKRHQLNAARLQGAVVAQAVGMSECSLPDVGDAFDVGVRVHGPDGSGCQAIVIEHPQRAKPHLLGVPVAIEGKVPAGVEPATLLLVDLSIAATLQHRVPVREPGSSASTVPSSSPR